MLANVDKVDVTTALKNSKSSAQQPAAFSRSRVLPRQVLRIAYDTMLRASDVAKSHGVSPRVVRRLRQVTAAAFIDHQTQVSRSPLDSLASRSQKLDFFYDVVTRDGTKQTMTLRFHPLLTNKQQISSWEILVVRRLLSWGWENGATGNVELVCPVIPCIGSDAGTIYDALHCHSQSSHVVDLCKALAEASDFSALF